ncbi:2-amino-4-hydroxy-6-hydroxymethyldihydropteridine diphosphokinase [Thalassovita sp.]|uniref:2-amino-4-hydroxy-6- hydroxymethyldihydropteridine diphosphokinase n=1 Tax=Thalassovita sp. TaxID=1979401 RepID=UPI0029DE68C9|nr:2-amino-4-hydroxy-6-hydroxymethyldihydropteridine diphosphokinase [Thalassovita sp.]
MTFNDEIVLALGSNQAFGEVSPADVLTAAIADLGRCGITVVARSRFFQTPCFPAGAGPDYVNAAVRVTTDLDPRALLKALHRVEAGLGRERRERWAARTVDIDLIAYGQRVLPDAAGYLAWRDLPPAQQVQQAPQGLILPHPRMHERAFVLVPMADVAPDWHHPVSGLTVTQMCNCLPKAALQEVRPL